MRKITIGLMALALVGLSFGAFAETAKIGVVDLQKIMQTAPQMKNIQSKLEKEFKPRRDKLVSMEQSLKSDIETFKKDSAVMSQSKRKEAEQKLVSAQKEFEQQGQAYQKELSSAHNEAMESFYEKVRAAITKVADKDHYNLVLQKDAAPYSSPKLDITDQVMKSIG